MFIIKMESFLGIGSSSQPQPQPQKPASYSAYCLKCKKKTQIHEPGEPTMAKNGRYRVKGKCFDCKSCNVSTFTKKSS